MVDKFYKVIYFKEKKQLFYIFFQPEMVKSMQFGDKSN